MGLDCLFRLPNGERDLELEAELAPIVNGHYFKGNSFRGSIYEAWFLEHLKVDLYKDMDSEKLLDVAVKIKQVISGGEWNPALISWYDCAASLRELQLLGIMFAMNAGRGNKMEACY